MLAALGPYTEEGIEIRDAAELRVKESDRIAALAENLRRMGASVEERPDGLKVQGRNAGKLHGAEIEPRGDHRIAMAFAVAGLAADGNTILRDADCCRSFLPHIFSGITSLGGALAYRVLQARATHWPRASHSSPIALSFLLNLPAVEATSPVAVSAAREYPSSSCAAK